MPSTTSVQLVNRLLQKARYPTVSSISEADALQSACLEHLNEALTEVLEDERWDFDYRHDGVLLTQGTVSTGTISVTNGSSSFSTSELDVVPTGDFVTKIMVTDDDSESQVAMRVLHYDGSNGTFDAEWLGSTNSAASYKAFVNEYTLPDTVLDVSEVRFQGGPVTLGFVDRKLSFDRVHPRPQDSIGDSPTQVHVGSRIRPTFNTSDVSGQFSVSSPPDLKLGMLVHQVPESKYRLDYSYLMKHPELTSEADSSLEGVPERVVQLIVLSAWSQALDSNIFNDPDLAKRNFETMEYKKARARAADGAQNLKPRPLASLDRKSRRGGRVSIEVDGITGDGTYGGAIYGESEYS